MVNSRKNLPMRTKSYTFPNIAGGGLLYYFSNSFYNYYKIHFPVLSFFPFFLSFLFSFISLRNSISHNKLRLDVPKLLQCAYWNEILHMYRYNKYRLTRLISVRMKYYKFPFQWMKVISVLMSVIPFPKLVIPNGKHKAPFQ